ncbi:hypothetical protein K466DRAFT_505127 [Polyporus arcularius HHB13444]|uniref:Uncharacterized protein n=1 Tax=Polyporus arcularius HHB13444 TaxID=1314778 RepID=A0A5C3NQR1_9APHY|nr:hypothetical protein K466DRAFT_505127 [Polyporus arcularius HHB13444]
MADVSVASSGFIGLRHEQQAADRRSISLTELLSSPEWQLKRWDGKYVQCLLPSFTTLTHPDRDCIPVLDKHGRVIALLAGHPNDPRWVVDVNDEFDKVMQVVHEAYRFPPDVSQNRRGGFATVSCGVSQGGGQTKPGNFALSAHNRAVWDALFKLKVVRRVANFANTAMNVFAPDMSAFYGNTLDAVCDADPKLKRNMSNNAFAAASINLGPNAVSYVHTDHLNLAWGWCAITAIGQFDATAGGHLILWDLRMVIEFPPGSTILIPSAILRHSNVALADPANERRSAFLQYSAGALFQWVECGHQTQKSFLAAGRTFLQSGKQRWAKGVSMFSLWEDLKARVCTST